MADLTDAELAELRKWEAGAELDKRAETQIRRLLKEMERRRKEMDSMIPVRVYRCAQCGERVPDNMAKVEEHLRSERHRVAGGTMIQTWQEKLGRLRELAETTSVEGKPETYGWVDDFRSGDSFALRDALARLDRCMDLLKRIEWNGDAEFAHGGCCPRCWNDKPDGHAAGCEIPALLGAS